MAGITNVYSVGAASAYRRSQSLGMDAVGGDRRSSALQDDFTTPNATGPQSFGQMVQSATENAISTVRQADVAAQKGVAGDMPLQQVIQATMAMESTVKVTVAMRDKIVEAYQEIMRMQI